ncbi:MAG: molybdopterin-dependent oxidoreductase [Candidatus Melainabacteria bacterium]|nr:molybdopterin-dependent oxidoreductase [Candidatus Melainabacteria bacterium]
MSEFNIVGKSMPQLGSIEKVTGKALYTDDLQFDDLHYALILRSPYAHARIVSIDTSRAEALPGVKAVLTGCEYQKTFGVLPISYDETVLAVSKVRHVGEGVAAVAATTLEIAGEALKLIEVEYEELPGHFDPAAGIVPVENPVHDHGRNGSNIHKQVNLSFGDLQAAHSATLFEVSGQFEFPAVTHGFLEPHSAVARWSDSADELTIWSSTQVPFYLRRQLSRVFDLPLEKVRVIKPYVGGGFGGKSDPFPHEFVVAALAGKVRKPVKITFSREEVFISHHARHPSIIKMQLGADREGKFTYLDLDATINGGAFGSFGVVTTYYNGVLTQGPYRINNFRYQGRRIYTNLPPSGAMRGHGAVNTRFVKECLIDELAENMAIDPCDFRLANLLPEHTLTATQFRITSNGMKECIERVRRDSQWDARIGKLPYGHGLGVACSFFISGSALTINRDDPQSIVRTVREEDGRFTVYSGASDIGQGSDTVLAQVTAEVLGVDLDCIRVISADTGRCPIDIGSYSSRVTFMAGNAARLAALNLLQALEKGTGNVGVGEYESPKMGGDYKGAGAGLSPSYSFGASVVEVKVDTRTGFIKIVKVWLAHDCGKALNPQAVEGQIEGSVHMGLGQFLSEQLQFEGGRIANASFIDYKMILPTDLPEINAIIVESNDPEGPFGAKECGEGALHPVLPAAANAVYNACGLRLRKLPAAPDYVLSLLRHEHTPVGAKKP